MQRMDSPISIGFNSDMGLSLIWLGSCTRKIVPLSKSLLAELPSRIGDGNSSRTDSVEEQMAVMVESELLLFPVEPVAFVTFYGQVSVLTLAAVRIKVIRSACKGCLSCSVVVNVIR